MKDKISTFKALDILNCSLKWINLGVNQIENDIKPIKALIEKFDIEEDYEGTDAEFLIKEYLIILETFIYRTRGLSKIAEKYLNGGGISNAKNTGPRYIVSNDNNSENEQ